MTKIIHSLFLTMAVLLVLPAFTGTNGGCNRKTKTNNQRDAWEAATKAMSAEAIKEKSTAKFIAKYKYLYAHLTGNSESDAMGGLDFSGNIYWAKDSVIWLSLRKFGFEGMRVIITPDSCVVLNRLDKTVMVRDASWLESQYGITDGFSMLQALLLNEPRYLQKGEKIAGLQDSMYMYTQRDGQRALKYLFSAGDFRMQRAEINELQRQMTVSCVFSGWAAPGAEAFASRQREWLYYSPEQGNMRLNLQFDDVEFNQKRDVRFEIPSHYARI